MGKITYNRGTTYTLTHVYQINGVPGTTGTKLLFTVKQSVDNDITDSAAIIQKDITMSGSSNLITIAPGDVSDSASDGNYVYDIKIIDSVLGTVLADSGKFILDVTATNRLT